VGKKKTPFLGGWKLSKNSIGIFFGEILSIVTPPPKKDNANPTKIT